MDLPESLPGRSQARQCVAMIVIGMATAQALGISLKAPTQMGANDISRWCTVWSRLERGSYAIDDCPWQAQTQETQVLIGKLVPAADTPRIARTVVEGLRAAAPDLPGALLHVILGPLPNAATAQGGRSQLLSAWLGDQTTSATSSAASARLPWRRTMKRLPVRMPSLCATSSTST